MSLWQRIIDELMEYGIRLDGSQVVLRQLEGQVECPLGEAISRLHHKVKENRDLLRKLWDEVADLQPSHIGMVNDKTQSLFLSAVRHLTSISSMDKFLVEQGIHARACRLLLEDSNTFSQDDMNKVIEYRLAIDWIIHLVHYDLYRSRLLQWVELGPEKLKSASSEKLQKLATGFGRQLDFAAGERSAPMWMVEDQLYDLFHEQGSSRPGTGGLNDQNRSNWERSHDMRHEWEDFDNPKEGNRFYMDHKNDGWLWENRFVDGPASSTNTHSWRR